uniref:ATPase AAA-type core domain-containing protein n=1 Tax=Globodera rostochiensis TaxID=31243 RepID=A0A914HWZ7_GLORO
MLAELEGLLSPCPEGLCLVECAPTLSPTFLFVHFIGTFSKKSFNPGGGAAGSKRTIFVSLHTNLELLRLNMSKMAQRLDLDGFRFISVADFLGDSLLFDCDRLFSWMAEFFFHEILHSVLPGRPHLLVLDDLFLFHPSLRPSKLLQFLLGLLARLPDRSFFLVTTGDASRLSAYAATFFHLHIRLTPIGDGLSKNITGQMEIFRRDLQRHSLPLRTLLHYHCGQRSAKTFVPGSKQLLI